MITPTELVLIIIALAILLIWGPEKLPKLARAFGKAMYEFRKAKEGLEKEANEASEPVKEVKKAVEEVKKELSQARS